MTAINLYSVTSLIRLGLGTSDPLVNWAVRTTAGAAYDKQQILQAFIEEGDRDGAIKWLSEQRFQASGKAMARGTDLHRAAEARALGQPIEVEDEILPYLEQYDRFLSDFTPEFIAAESPVYSPEVGGYAGTLDAIVRIDGKTLVADLKTTPHGPDDGRMRPPYPETALQLCAYRRASLVGVMAEQRYASGKRYYVFDPDQAHEPMPETDGAVCVVISPKDYMVVPVRTDDQVWEAWLHVIECARWQVFTSKDVFGPQIRPSVEAVA